MAELYIRLFSYYSPILPTWIDTPNSAHSGAAKRHRMAAQKFQRHVWDVLVVQEHAACVEGCYKPA